MSIFLFDSDQLALDYQDLFESLPYPISVKNPRLEFVASNKLLADLLGFNNSNQLLGLTDAEIKCPASEYSEVFAREDQEALSGIEQSYINIASYSDLKPHAIYITKKKILDKNNNHFLLTSGVEISLKSILNIFSEACEHTQLDQISGSYRIQHQDINLDGQTKVKLTKRQSECLFYLLRGKTMKEVAYILNITHRTVEEHLKCLKTSFDCNTKSQVIEKAHFLGFAKIIPASLINI